MDPQIPQSTEISWAVPGLEIGHVQSIYDRIPKPELSRDDTRSYLRRLERLKKSCQDQLTTYIHYASVDQQLATETLGNYVVVQDDFIDNGELRKRVAIQKKQADGTFVSIPKEKLEASKVTLIDQKRADAVIVFTRGACRVNKFEKIGQDHDEILFVLALSRDVAVAALNDLLAHLKSDQVFAEVPESWDGYFKSAGFKQHPYEVFGNLLPKHSFLHTWVLDKPDDLQNVNKVVEVSLDKDLKFPADPDIPTNIKQPATQSGLLIDTDAYPTEVGKGKARFLSDYTTILNFARSSNGQIELDDAQTARTVLQRMFGFARMVDKQETWRQMIEVERAFADFGIFASPSTQTLYLDLVKRDNLSEMLSNLWLMRNFASMFPRFAPQQIALEVKKLQPKMTQSVRTESRKWIVANLSQPNDFGALNPFSFETLKAVHARMLALRQSWKERVGGLARSIAILEGQIPMQGEEDQKDPDVAPIVALQKKTADIVQNAKDVEAEFQRTLTSSSKELKEKSHILSVKDWIQESQTSIQTLQTLTFDVKTLSTDTTDGGTVVIPAEKATALVAGIVAQSRQDNATTETTGGGTVVNGGVPLQTASPDNDALEKLMATFNQNWQKLQDLEVAKKKQIRENMTKLAAEALGSKTELEKLAKLVHPDLSEPLQKERQSLLERAQGCDLLLQSSILNPMFKQNADATKESQISETQLTNLHNTLVSQRDCLERYYKAMQMLENRITVENDENGVIATRDTLLTLIGYERNADTAITEGKMVIEKAKSASFLANIEGLQNDIDAMNVKRIGLTQMHQTLETLLQAQPKPRPMAKAERINLLKVAKETLEDVVKLLLGLRQKWVVSTEQFKLLSAMQTNSKNLELAAKEAEESARIAAEQQKRLEIEQATNTALGDRLAVIASDNRHTTASFSNLEDKKKSFMQNHQITLMQLAQQLQTDIDNRKTPVDKIRGHIFKINDYLQKHKDALDADDFAEEKAQILESVMEAKRLLDQRAHHHKIQTLKWEEKQARMRTISGLMDDLRHAVDAEDVDDIRDLLSELNRLDFKSVYVADRDGRELLAEARDILKDDRDSDQNYRKRIAAY